MNVNSKSEDSRAVQSARQTRTPLTRPWREVIRGSRRPKNQRVVPLPLTALALALPFLAAWAGAAPGATASGPTGHVAAATLPEPLRFLGRDNRVPESSGGYVDVWGPPAPWEADALSRRGTVPAGR